MGRARERVGRSGGLRLSWAGPGREALGCWAKTEISTENPFLFLFLFPIFQSIFQKDFEFPFEFNSNYSIQKFKCCSMNAQSCFYSYI
jgi:hypothetical protein